eukprot:CAMPEP_0113913054 /NCGR_PEP_ID=MMETSP0780_2-20120614/29315_1 /TAXON_ID=652834 /ORGANISM="Palpitomonas bilix" /LENGTH=398 /DNA_ID=CAMNT_0000910173 /DNA_START=69 /DNA_END=1265 /DNA_ORIENTATION=+ /assembly_acc=CAM_ASM_000599
MAFLPRKSAGNLLRALKLAVLKDTDLKFTQALLILRVRGLIRDAVVTPLDLIRCGDTQQALLILRVRGLIRDAVEDIYGAHFELYPEFSAMIGWGAGSSIGPHPDNGKPYISKRHLSSILYLNCGEDGGFSGGSFEFLSPQEVEEVARGRSLEEDQKAFHKFEIDYRGGELQNCDYMKPPQPQHAFGWKMSPNQGSLLTFGSGIDNIHRVTPVRDIWNDDRIIEDRSSCPRLRLTLTVWFTTDPSESEDRLLKDSVTKYLLFSCPPPYTIPLPPDSLGLSLLCRMQVERALLGKNNLLHVPRRDVLGNRLQSAISRGILEAGSWILGTLKFDRGEKRWELEQNVHTCAVVQMDVIMPVYPNSCRAYFDIFDILHKEAAASRRQSDGMDDAQALLALLG